MILRGSKPVALAKKRPYFCSSGFFSDLLAFFSDSAKVGQHRDIGLVVFRTVVPWRVGFFFALPCNSLVD